MTLSITILGHYAESRYAECRILFIVMLNVIILSDVMLNVVMLGVVAIMLLCPIYASSETVRPALMLQSALRVGWCAKDKHSSFLGPFVNTFHFLRNLQMGQKARA
jgi:hypothetical protein